MSVHAILLLGPTGSGKTPLGEHLERHGLWHRRCLHFDFGAQLRAAAAGELPPQDLSPRELAVIAESLRTGALLEDENFPIASRTLCEFIRRRQPRHDDGIILNGLPRHAGQARDVAGIVEVIAVVSLECRPEIAHDRIRRNTGGDRTGRCDDDLDAVIRKLDIYRQHTEPLIQHYRSAGIPAYRITVSADTRPADAHRDLSAQPQPATW